MDHVGIFQLKFGHIQEILEAAIFPGFRDDHDRADSSVDNRFSDRSPDRSFFADVTRAHDDKIDLELFDKFEDPEFRVAIGHLGCNRANLCNPFLNRISQILQALLFLVEEFADDIIADQDIGLKATPEAAVGKVNLVVKGMEKDDFSAGYGGNLDCMSDCRLGQGGEIDRDKNLLHPVKNILM